MNENKETAEAEAGTAVAKKSLPTAAKIGLAVGGVVLVAAAAVGIVAFVRSRGSEGIDNSAD